MANIFILKSFKNAFFLVKTLLIIDYHTFLLSYNHTLNPKKSVSSVAMAVFDHLHFVVPIEKHTLWKSKFPSIEKQYMTFYLLAAKYVWRSNRLQ